MRKNTKIRRNIKEKNKIIKIEESPEFQIKEITFSGGMTINMGDYQSFRADTAITLKTNKEYTTIEEKKEAIVRIKKEGWEIVDDIVGEKLRKAKKAGKQ